MKVYNKYLNKKVDAFVSIHHNAYNGKWNSVTGVEIYTDKNPTSKDTALAKAIYKNLPKYTGLKGRGLKKQNWYVINQNKIPAVLVEGGFMDSKIDHPVITSDKGQEGYAKAVAEGLIEFLSLKKKSTSTSTSSTTKKETTSSKKSTEEIAREVIAGKWGNGEDRKTKLKKAGYDYNTVQAKVNELLGSKNTTSKTITKKTTTTSTKYYPKCASKYTSIVDALKSINVNSSFSNRYKIAKKNAIKLYIGTSKQNTKMLELLKKGKLIKA